MRKILLFALMLICQLSYSQIYTLDFDSNNSGYTSGPDGFGNDGPTSTDYYDISSTGFGGNYLNSAGNFMAAQDIDGVTGFSTDVQVFEINGINISSFTNLICSLDLAEDSGQGWDDSDNFQIEYSIDGSIYNNLIQIGVPSGFNQTPQVLQSTNGANIGTFLTNQFTSFTAPIFGTGNSINLRITFDLNSGSEDIAFDNLIITGDDNSGTPGITLISPAGSTSETGTTTTFTAVLNTAPTSDVVLDIASADTGENTVSPSMVTFTTANWDQPQTITLTGVDDALFDGDQITSITATSNNAMTSDVNYQSLQDAVNVTNIDDEVYTNTDVRINEADVDQSGTDFAEFIELFGTPNLSLNNLVIVLYNGNGDVSYETYDLDGFSLDANGFLLIGATGVTGASGLVPFTPEIEIKSTGLQNGADAIALYSGSSSDFPNGTAVTTTNLIDALVYDTNDSDDSGLAVLFNDPTIFDAVEMIQVNEDENSDSEFQSIQRGSWFVAAPTPRGENILPVKLTSFTVDSRNDQNNLSWTTATEINNDFFSIERSNDGKNFETIGKVIGTGNSYSSVEYNFIDNEPLTGSNYYRLKQVDFDGRYEYSDIIRADNKASRIKIYPTSTSDYVTINMDEQQVASVIIFNEIGQTVKEMTISEMQTRIDISDLPSGLLFVQVNAQSGKEIKRIIKL